MDPQLLTYYEAIERASADMLHAARAGNWDEVVKLEGACVLLISQLKHAAQAASDAAPFGGAAPLPDTEPAAFDLEAAHAEAMAVDATRNAARSAKAALAEEARMRASAEADAQMQVQTQAASAQAASIEAARTKARIMQRILVNDAEIRQLAEPWLQNLDDALQGRRRTLH